MEATNRFLGHTPAAPTHPSAPIANGMLPFFLFLPSRFFFQLEWIPGAREAEAGTEPKLTGTSPNGD